jgi:hypothetical protein
MNKALPIGHNWLTGFSVGAAHKAEGHLEKS